MIRPITTDELVQFLRMWQDVPWFGIVVVLLISVVVLLFCRFLYIYVLATRHKTVSGISFVPASTDSNNLERMEELFGFVRTLLKQRRLLQRVLPMEHVTLEVVADSERGMWYSLWVPQHLVVPLLQGMKGIFPGARLSELERQEICHFRLLRQFKLRHHPALPLRSLDKEDGADPVSFVASSLAELSFGERVVIQFAIKPLGGMLSWRVRRAKPEGFGVLSERVQQKQRQALFAVSLRLGIESDSDAQAYKRAKTVTSALYGLNQASAQEIMGARIWNPLQRRLIGWGMAQRLALFSPVLSLSGQELSGLVHPATGRAARAEDISTNRSALLPLPTSLKNRPEADGVAIGVAVGSTNKYPIVLTDDERSRHVYLLGQTGSGKSTILFHMIKKDIAAGHGVAVIDPHGDLIDDVIGEVVAGEEVDEVAQRVVLIDPSDLRYPVGINLLELPEGLDDPDQLELEKELVCEAVISIFKRVFNQEEEANAHRIEYMLRNVIHTAFTVPGATVFTVYDLINNPKYRKQVLSKLQDENLLSFWKNEFLKAGDWQQVKMVSGVTAKIGRFLFSPTVRRILEQSHSTINFDQVLSEQKVLLCNLSEGKIGEDNSHLMGAVIITKIHLAALRRARLEQSARTSFYLYVDEFQHFATSYFTRLLSGGRKFGLRVIIAQQSTAQLKDPQMIQVILANTGTSIVFRTASSMDADLLLPLFEPLVTREDIVNLPRHHFYLKMGAVESHPAFSGLTNPIEVVHDKKSRQALVNESRKQYAHEYQPAERPEFSDTADEKREQYRRPKAKPKTATRPKKTTHTQPRLG